MPFEKLKHVCLYEPDGYDDNDGKCFLDTLDDESKSEQSQEEEAVEEELTNKANDIDENN